MTIVLTFIQVNSSWAYEQPLHQKMSDRAFSKAASQNNFLIRLGVIDAEKAAALKNELAQGAYEEDGDEHSLATFWRPLNHFFDPVHHVPLTVPSPILLPLHCNPVAARADNWGLHDVINSYRLDEIRTHYYRALTGSAGEREAELRTTFRSLGHLMHLIEDMGQPEHTRNDQHRFPFWDRHASNYEVWTLDSGSEL